MLQTGIVKGIFQVQAPGTLGTSDRRGTKVQHHSFVIPTLLQIIIPGQTRQGDDYFGLLLSCPAPWGTSPLEELLLLRNFSCWSQLSAHVLPWMWSFRAGENISGNHSPCCRLYFRRAPQQEPESPHPKQWLQHLWLLKVIILCAPWSDFPPSWPNPFIIYPS